MRSINPFEIWLSPLRNSRSRNTLPHCLSILGGGE
ncbi:hypothetical protein PS659_05232 [Pseudomonas fluorescens]|uniref:Uncharacterized protein n=1 Tax=Pseudomonas fluorescens TaxID=294 RepID=A0A5E6X9J0_PSEFL|nr:hypothetical protein PS659_05232 [Pseudomonas fluorescens]